MDHTFIATTDRHAMGEVQGTLFSPDFNRSVVIEARPERLSSDARAFLIRDLTDRLGLPDLAGKHLGDRATPTGSAIRSSSSCVPGCSSWSTAGPTRTMSRCCAPIPSCASPSRRVKATGRFVPRTPGPVGGENLIDRKAF